MASELRDPRGLGYVIPMAWVARGLVSGIYRVLSVARGLVSGLAGKI